jgi:hypothetical protein
LIKGLYAEVVRMDPKTCSRCGETKIRGEFYRSSRSSDGLTAQCKPCRRQMSKEQREKAPRSRAGKDNTPVLEKFCHLCRTTKPREAYSRNRTSSDGLQAYCKVCVATKQRIKLYGVTEGEIASLVEAQGGACASCGHVAKLVIDHCHTSGRVRSLLCNACNTAEGLLRTPARARALARYMEEHCAQGEARQRSQ